MCGSLLTKSLLSPVTENTSEVSSNFLKGSSMLGLLTFHFLRLI